MAEFVMKELVREAGHSDEIRVASKALHTDALGGDVFNQPGAHRGNRFVPHQMNENSGSVMGRAALIRRIPGTIKLFKDVTWPSHRLVELTHFVFPP